MKKLIALSVLASMVMSVYVFGAELDFTSMTTDELLELRSELNDEINKRLFNGSDQIPIGSYVCGADINPGKYLFVGLENDDSNYTVFATYKSVEDFEDDDVLEIYYLEAQEQQYIELKDGQVLLVRNPVMIGSLQASWMPSNDN